MAWWVERDRKQALRVIKLIEAIQRDPFQGIGQPEPLKHDFIRLLVTADKRRTSVGLSSAERQDQNSGLSLSLLNGNRRFERRYI